MDDLFTGRQLEDRAKTLSATINLLLDNTDVAPGIDKNRIGALGFGSGGAAVLLLGGALPDCGDWKNYCADAMPKEDVYCNPWAKNRLNALCGSLPLTKSLADNRVGAVASVAPGYGMLFSRDSFRYFYPPLLLMAAEKDAVNLPALHAQSLYRLLNLLDKKPLYHVLEGADAGALTAPCPYPIDAELPELCRSVTLRQRRSIHQNMQSSLSDFFLRHLGSSDSPPVIPPPPDLTPPPPPSPPPPALRGRPQRRGSK
jgi:predicted dienelactone hydrolase